MAGKNFQWLNTPSLPGNSILVQNHIPLNSAFRNQIVLCICLQDWTSLLLSSIFPVTMDLYEMINHLIFLCRLFWHHKFNFCKASQIIFISLFWGILELPWNVNSRTRRKSLTRASPMLCTEANPLLYLGFVSPFPVQSSPPRPLFLLSLQQLLLWAAEKGGRGQEALKGWGWFAGSPARVNVPNIYGVRAAWMPVSPVGPTAHPPEQYYGNLLLISSLQLRIL